MEQFYFLFFESLVKEIRDLLLDPLSTTPFMTTTHYDKGSGQAWRKRPGRASVAPHPSLVSPRDRLTGYRKIL